MKTLTFDRTDHLYFTSDLHLGHSNIIQYCKRPFNDTEEMDKEIINNWNDVISNDDIVFVLGDFCWKMGIEGNRYLEALNGHKILIVGNHDLGKTSNKFERVVDGFLNIKVADPDGVDGRETGTQRLTLCHYPMLSWYQSHRGAWQLYGHWHGGKVKNVENNEEITDYVKEEHVLMDRIRPSQYDVGVDGNNYYPISYEQVKQIINKQKNGV